MPPSPVATHHSSEVWLCTTSGPAAATTWGDPTLETLGVQCHCLEPVWLLTWHCELNQSPGPSLTSRSPCSLQHASSFDLPFWPSLLGWLFTHTTRDQGGCSVAIAGVATSPPTCSAEKWIARGSLRVAPGPEPHVLLDLTGFTLRGA